MTERDVHFMQLALQEARKSRTEDDRIHPMVGAVVVKDAQCLDTAFRGECPGDHAEFIALEKKLTSDVLTGATVYTTLEPCTTRNHPNVPCAEWLINRKVSRVVIGMLDPNQSITGKGVQRLRDANIATDFFPSALMAEAEEMNRHFIRFQRERTVSGTVTYGLSELRMLMEKQCLRANKNIRLLVHALGAEYKLPDEFAHKLADYIREQETKGMPVRFWPVIVVNNDIPPEEFAKTISTRAAIYAKYGVTEFVKPRFLKTDSPMGIDMLIIDDRCALLLLTTAFGSKQTQLGISFEQNTKLLSELIDWFDQVIKTRAISLEELRTSTERQAG